MSTPLGIVSANRKAVQDICGGGPNMRSTVRGMMRPLALVKVAKVKVDFEIEEVETVLTTRGVVQAFSAQELGIKPEGERSWDWKMIHATSDLVLKNDDVIMYRGIKYSVMAQSDNSEYGTIEYEICNKYIRG